jgi:hypothetical protein
MSWKVSDVEMALWEQHMEFWEQHLELWKQAFMDKNIPKDRRSLFFKGGYALSS